MALRDVDACELQERRQSSYEIARALEVTQKTAWFMLHRIRLRACTTERINKMTGTVEADETFIGGKARNMHAGKAREKIHGARTDRQGDCVRPA